MLSVRVRNFQYFYYNFFESGVLYYYYYFDQSKNLLENFQVFIEIGFFSFCLLVIGERISFWFIFMIKLFTKVTQLIALPSVLLGNVSCLSRVQRNLFARFYERKIYFPYFTLVLIRTADSEKWFNIVVMGGFALVNNNKITILVNEAELGSVC